MILMPVNKVVAGGNILIDLTTDTVASSDHILAGKVGHLRDGSQVTGTYAPTYQQKAVTPTRQTQIVEPDEGYDALDQVTVNPIPSNYGLITWDGSVMTIS